jgi:3-phosphoshikimate 1-carboxyvinyltransferase
MASIRVRPQRKPLQGSVPVPSDRDITHRALILAALSNGPSEIRGFGYGDANLHTLRALGRLGVRYEDDEKGTIRVRGVGLAGLKAPEGTLDAGRSAACLRLLTGVLSGQTFDSVIGGDAALERRDMWSVVAPLIRRGARIEGRRSENEGELTAPLAVGALPPRGRLDPIEYALGGPNDHAKGALLLSGLFASGPTTILEPIVSRDHTERLLDALGMPVKAAGSMISLHPPADPLAIRGFEMDVPGDISAAIFILVAAQIVPGSNVNTRRTGLNPTRSAALEVIRLSGGSTGISPAGNSLGEPFGDLSSRGSRLRGIALDGELLERSLDELPALLVLSARARGVTEVAAPASRESASRLAAMASLLRAFGVAVEERDSGLALEGQPEAALQAARVSSGGDHRVAMAAVLLGLSADGESVVDDADCIAESYPRFVGTLRALGADLEVIP